MPFSFISLKIVVCHFHILTIGDFFLSDTSTCRYLKMRFYDYLIKKKPTTWLLLFTDEEILQATCHDRVKLGISFFSSFLDGFILGNLSVGDMVMLIKERNRVVELFCVLQKRDLIDCSIVPKPTKADVKASVVLIQIMEWRRQEINAFNKRIKQLKDAVCFLENIPRGNDIMYIFFFLSYTPPS